MVVELGQAALGLANTRHPSLVGPARALIGYRSDHHRSYLGWRRIPPVVVQFGGLAFMPFALILMTEPHNGPALLGPVANGVVPADRVGHACRADRWTGA